MKISLITTERNEAGAIAEFIDSVLAQSLKPDEIVIADADSNDGTKEIIQSYIDRGAPLKLVIVPGNRSVGRNAAIEAASHEVIAVADVGCRLDKDWFKHITQPFRDDPKTGAVSGFFLAEPKTHFEKVSTDLMLADNDAVDVKTWLPSSRSIAFTKTAWRKAGTYPDYREFEKRLQMKCGGEDTLFDLAIKDAGYEFADGLKAIVYWRPRPDFKAFYLQYYWYAVGDGMDLTGLADHAFFRRLTMKYVVLALATVVLAFTPWPWLVLLPLGYLGAGLGRRSLTPWRKSKGNLADLGLMLALLLAYDLSQVFGYWYGYTKRPAKKSSPGVKYSTVFAVKNEERYLPDALESVKGCDDVVVVVDDNTTDRTAEIAKAAGARVFTRKFDGFASQKNFTIDQAKHDWVLLLDGDERVTPGLRAVIEALEPAEGVAAYEFAWRNYLGKKWLAHGGLYPDRHTRLFDRRRARYGAREIHETLDVRGETKTLSGDVEHLTYANIGAYYAKVMKYAREEASWTKHRPSVRSAVKEFLVRYIKQGGWRDGWAGLASASLLGFYRLVVRWNMSKGGAK